MDTLHYNVVHITTLHVTDNVKGDIVVIVSMGTYIMRSYFAIAIIYM